MALKGHLTPLKKGVLSVLFFIFQKRLNAQPQNIYLFGIDKRLSAFAK
jgi:hypothetical protein